MQTHVASMFAAKSLELQLVDDELKMNETDMTVHEIQDIQMGSPMDLCLDVDVNLISHSPDHNSTRDEQTFNTINTSGTVNNVGGDFVVHGAYNVFQEPTDSAIHMSVTVKCIVDIQMAANIEKWMDAPDTSPNFNAARKKHQPGTGSWFLDGYVFTRWKEDPDVLLWLHGGPGCGKTVLCAAAIQAVIDFCDSKASTGYAYFFFDARSAEAALLGHEKLVRSIIMQLAHRCDGIPVALAEIYAKCDKGSRQPPIEMLEATLLRIVDSFDDVYIVIDSLDECSERKDLLAWIRSMTSRASGKLHMMATSRSEPDIRRGLQAIVGLEDILVIGSAIKADISTFLNTKLAAIDDWDEPGLKELVKNSLLDGSDGMFRWAALQLDELLECVSREELEQQLKSLPKGLDETYAKILSRSARPKHLKMFLQCLAFSRRPMTVHELAEVVTVDFTASDLPAYNGRLRCTDPSKAVNICYGLVTEVDGIVKLAHFSVKEYLVSETILSGAAAKYHLTEPLSHATIAQTSLAYLLHFDKPDSLSEDTLSLFPLARYAAEHWVAHCHSSGSDDGDAAALQHLQLRFFEPSPPYAMHNWLFLHDWEISHGVKFDHNACINFAPPFYYACRSGLTTAVSNLINKGADVNDNRGNLGPPLTAASDQGHLETVQLLLAHDADVDAEGGKYSGTALHQAARRGHLEIVELLLLHSANVNAVGGGTGESALVISSENGHLAIVELLLAHGADVGAGSGKLDGTALQRAALHGHLAIIQLLLSHSADANEPEEPYWGHALSMASWQGHLEIVQLLLAHGAEVNAVGGYWKKPALLRASEYGHLTIVRLLLVHGAHVNAKSRSGETALDLASSEGHVAIVELLREHGAVEVERPSRSATSTSSAGDTSGVGSGIAELADEDEEDEAEEE